MRYLHDHETNPANRELVIAVADKTGAGGAHHEYIVQFPSEGFRRLVFQNGPIKEAGVNGLTHEVLLAILIDRLRCFQAGPFSCRENALALTKLEEALHWLHARTREREARGVEGTTQV